MGLLVSEVKILVVIFYIRSSNNYSRHSVLFFMEGFAVRKVVKESSPYYCFYNGFSVFSLILPIVCKLYFESEQSLVPLRLILLLYEKEFVVWPFILFQKFMVHDRSHVLYP